jgi:hypothetical protein
MSKLMIFQKILPGCEEGNPEAWRAFLGFYTPMAAEFLGVYTHWDPDARLALWRECLGELSANDCAGLKKLPHQSEREFLVGMRAFLQDRAAPRLDARQDAADPPAPTRESLTALLSGLPVIHQEVAFLALAGYSQKTVENILRTTPTVAGEGLARLGTAYAAVMQRPEDRCLWPSAWVGICATARADSGKDCTPLRQLIRMLDGQASWYDKSPAEEHRTKCLHCLELWTSLLEVVAWDRTRQPWPDEKVEPMLAVVPIRKEKPKASLFARMLGK